MKKIYLLVLFVFGFSAFAQQKGISYQALIINPKAVAAPGYNGSSIPLANKSICLSFQIVNSANQVEYQESQSITTDAYGMVNVVIGTGTSGTGLVANLDGVKWNQGSKKLVVGVNTDGVCSNYTEISNQLLNYSPYSLYAQDADLKDGYVTDVKVAMGINPTKVGLGNVNNTSDANKPVSIATQTALDLKANATDVTTSLALKEDASNKSNATLGTSTTLYPTQNAVKTYVDVAIAGATIVDADTATKGKIKLAGDLAGTADLPTVPGLALKANAADVTTSLGLKEDLSNKSSDIATDASPTINYPTVKAVKDYVDANSNTGTIVDADTTTKGKIKLAGDLAGTADLPTVPGLALKAPLASPSFTGTVSGIDKTMVGLSNVDNTTDVDKPVSNATQTALALKANSTDVTTSLALKENLSNKSSDIVSDGTSTTKYPTVKAIKDYVDAQNAAAGVADGSITSAKIANATIVNEDVATTAAIDFSKLNIQKSDIVGLGLTQSDIGLTNVDNTTDVNKPVSTATQTALNLKANSADVTTSLALKANLASPTFTGTVSGIDKTMVGLSNVDNTTDVNKPVSSATQTALALKANLASPTFTGTVSGIDKTMVGLSNVDNTTDVNKPVSTATQTALNLKENLSNKSSDIVTDATSTTKYLTVKAIKDYVDTQNAAQNATRPTSDQVFATAGQTSFTLTQTPLTNSTTSPVKPNVWMFINGVRTNNLAYSVSGTTVTYSAANNNSYTLVVGDRVQFDYTY